LGKIKTGKKAIRKILSKDKNNTKTP